MILTALRAENVLKYSRLSIDVGERKRIAVLGPNESGKSTIGETICFALFGRTWATGPGEIEKVVRWGESRCSTALDFSVGERRYALARQLDRDGNHSARLSLAGSPDDPIARGPSGVLEALTGILGFGYEEYVESFYLPQREIISPQPHSQSVRITAGVARLERVGRDLRGEIASREAALAGLQSDRQAVERDIAALGADREPLPTLTEERRAVTDRLHRAEALVEDVEAGRDTSLESAGEATRARLARRRALLLGGLSLTLALVVAACWALLTWGGGSAAASAVRHLLSQTGRAESLEPWIGAVAAGLGAVFLLSWLRLALLGRRIARLREKAGRLGATLDEARAVEGPVAAGGAASGRGRESGGGEEPAFDPEADAPSRPGEAEFRALRDAIEEGPPPAELVRSYAEREASWLKQHGHRLRERRAVLDGRIAEAEDRARSAERLKKVLEGLDAKRAEVEGEIADRRRGLELLQGAVGHLSEVFNRDVRDSMASLLPRLTDGRHEYIQLDQELVVRVFSGEKRDFMDLDEVSGGTQRQIMLALRLALARSLLWRIGSGRQLAFLDEPFAFFDEDRARRTLEALADLDDLSQIWVVAQELPAGGADSFDLQIRCDPSGDSLVVSEAPAADPAPPELRPSTPEPEPPYEPPDEPAPEPGSPEESSPEWPGSSEAPSPDPTEDPGREPSDTPR